MTDLISPMLIARVERSLRKRVKSDVRPHLLRCAAHAHSEEEFVASAARLLLDMRERQHWHSVWTWRIQHPQGGPDSMPAEFDTTSAGFLEPLSHHPENGQPITASMLIATPNQINNLREALARELGADAGEVINQELRTAESAVDLMERIESHLADDSQRARFRDAAAVAFSTI